MSRKKEPLDLCTVSNNMYLQYIVRIYIEACGHEKKVKKCSGITARMKSKRKKDTGGFNSCFLRFFPTVNIQLTPL